MWETERVKVAAAVSLSVETWALDNECRTWWASEIEQCMDATTVSFLYLIVKGVTNTTKDGLIVIWSDF